MALEKIDYTAILADMKLKRSALDTSITALEAALASGALGQATEGNSSSTPNGPAGQPMDLPSGAFLGKSMPDAVKLYLTAMRQRRTARDIAEALQEGGMVSTSDSFDSVVQACLQRLKLAGQLLKFPDGWGLAEWYPAGFRSSGEKAPKPVKKKGKKSKAIKTEKSAEPKPIKAIGLEQRIESILVSEPGRVFSVLELADTLRVMQQAVSLALGRMCGKEKAMKWQGGYRAFAAAVQEMHKAG